MARRQHHRGKKRLKKWHRGHNEARQWTRTNDLPELGTGADPTSGAPKPLRRKQTGGRVHGDAV